MLQFALTLLGLVASLEVPRSFAGIPTDEQITAFRVGSLSWASCVRDYVFPNNTHTPGVVYKLHNMSGWYRQSDVAETRSCAWPSSDEFCIATMRNTPRQSTQADMVAFPCDKHDIQLWILLARKYALSLSAYATGHEFLNRHMSRNVSLVIRTGILRDVEFDLNVSNRFKHPPGVMRLGAGLKWGDVHPLCQTHKRICVSGQAPSVGVVGWMLGGGHGQLVPNYGLGADHVAEVELVAADGSLVIANANGTRYQLPGQTSWAFSSDTGIFWAVRGGGGLSWGVVTHITYYVHYLPNGIHLISANMAGKLDSFQDAMAGFGKWSASLGQRWSYYVGGKKYGQIPCQDQEKDCESVSRHLNLTSEKHCDISTLNRSACMSIPDCAKNPEKFGLLWANWMCKKTCDSCWVWNLPINAWYLGRSSDAEYIRVKAALETLMPYHQVTKTAEVDYGQDFAGIRMADTFEGITPEFVPAGYHTMTAANVAKDVMNSTMFASQMAQVARIPYEKNYSAYILFYKVLADGFRPNFASPNAVGPDFRNAAVEVGYQVIPNPGNLADPEGQGKAAEEMQAPLYKLGSTTYFSEGDFDMDDWKNRYWGEEMAAKLEAVKAKWDPELVFTCRHCIGDGMTPKCGDETSLPPRALCLPSVRNSSAYPSLIV